ncbi:MAG: GDP-mannose 4,6-dehydratase [Bacteriovoracaceae bacterium]
MGKVALITGITGQDGSYLAEYLVNIGYEVHGIVRHAAIEDATHRLYKISHILDKIHLHSGSLESYASLFNVLQKIKPDECYHLASQSFVSYSFEDEFSTMNSNVNGTHYLLSALHQVVPNCKFYFAGSSEMFGKAEEFPQNEKTKFHPRSVYGITKVVGYELTRNYRESNKMFACTGILFNHESPRRGFEFVTRKITSSAAKIKLGMSKELRLGNIEAKRDWGYAGDYVQVMHKMLQHSVAEDFVIGSGESHTVREFIEIAFKALNLNFEEYLVIDPRFYRPSEVEVLLADPTKAKTLLNWKPKVKFEELVLMMVKADYEHFSKLK